MRYLGIETHRPKVAVFDFTGCEGCELQLANKEETLVPFLKAVEIVQHREVTSERRDDYDIALIDGTVSRPDEIERLKKIRAQAKIVVAMGACACFGGVHKMKNALDLDAANREVYGKFPKETMPVRPVHDVIPVDVEIPGCPVNKDEIERAVQHLILAVPFSMPAYPVCIECKQRYTTCMFEKGHLCLGPISRAGCTAPCPSNGLACWGCRGPAQEPNYRSWYEMALARGFSKVEIAERLNFFGGHSSFNP